MVNSLSTQPSGLIKYCNTLCRLVAVYGRFGRKHCVILQGRSTFLRRAVTYRNARLHNSLQCHQHTKSCVSDPAVPNEKNQPSCATRQISNPLCAILVLPRPQGLSESLSLKHSSRGVRQTGLSNVTLKTMIIQRTQRLQMTGALPPCHVYLNCLKLH